jgi:hypothetical protein
MRTDYAEWDDDAGVSDLLVEKIEKGTESDERQRSHRVSSRPSEPLVVLG